MVAVYGDPPDVIAAQLDEARRLTQGVLGANFILTFVDSGQTRECVANAAASAPRANPSMRPRGTPAASALANASKRGPSTGRLLVLLKYGPAR
jgi:hypothetical protein